MKVIYILNRSCVKGNLILTHTTIEEVNVRNTNIVLNADLRALKTKRINLETTTIGSLILLGLENTDISKEVWKNVHSLAQIEDECSFYRLLLRASHKYRIAGSYDLADKYFYLGMIIRRKCIQSKHKVLGRILAFIDYMVADLSCKYGTAPLRPVLLWFSLVLIFAIIYWVIGGIFDSNNYPIETFPNIAGLIKSIYFSLITITTIGYGDYRPAPGLPYLLAGTEAVLGLFIWALLISVFARRYMY